MANMPKRPCVGCIYFSRCGSGKRTEPCDKRKTQASEEEYRKLVNYMFKDMPKKPCISCVYFATCGSTTRTEPCKGRQTKREQKEAKTP